MDRENELMNNRDDEMEIDLLELFRAWKRKIWLIVLITFLGGSIGFAFSKLALTPQYTSTVMMYIVSKETTLTSLADLQIGSQLTQDYKVITTSRPVIDGAIERIKKEVKKETQKEMENPPTYKELSQKISIGNPTDTRILTITVTDPDPKMAKITADAIADEASDYIGDIMEMIPPKVIEYGQVATEKTSPSNSKNAMLGAMLGLVLTCGIITLQTILNDTVQTEEDVEKYLGLTVLASVPMRSGEGESGAKSKKAQKKRQKEARKKVKQEIKMAEKTNGRSRKKGTKK